MRLTSGKQLDATKIEVVEKGLKVTLAVSGGTARVTYPFHRIDPTDLVPLLDRHLLLGKDAKADAQAADIYAEAYNANPELYAFLRSLETYETIVDDKTTLMLSSDSDLFQYLESASP